MCSNYLSNKTDMLKTPNKEFLETKCCDLDSRILGNDIFKGNPEAAPRGILFD